MNLSNWHDQIEDTGPGGTSKCKFIVDIAYDNLCRIHSYLSSIGYQFADPANSFVIANRSARNTLDEFENRYGRLPTLLRCWYERIDSVDFRQAQTQSRCKAGEENNPPNWFFGLGSHCRLIIRNPKTSLDARNSLIAERSQYCDDDKYTNFLPLGSYTSYGDPAGFYLPSEQNDAPVYYQEDKPVYLLDDLQEIFQWGGFPFWQNSINDSTFYSPYDYTLDYKRYISHIKRQIKPYDL